MLLVLTKCPPKWGDLGRAMKRILVHSTLLSVVMLTLLATPALAKPPIGHDHTRLTATVRCDYGHQEIIWRVQNFTRDTEMTITKWESSPDASTPSFTVVPPKGHIDIIAEVTHGTKVEHAEVWTHWPTDRVDHVTLDVPISPCEVPPPPSTTTVPPSTTTRPTVPPTTVVVTVPSTQPPTPSTGPPAPELPNTGSSSGPLAGIAVASIVAGALIMGLTRKRRLV